MAGLRSVLLIVMVLAVSAAPVSAEDDFPPCEPVIFEGIHLHPEQNPPEPHIHYDIQWECV